MTCFLRDPSEVPYQWSCSYCISFIPHFSKFIHVSVSFPLVVSFNIFRAFLESLVNFFTTILSLYTICTSNWDLIFTVWWHMIVVKFIYYSAMRSHCKWYLTTEYIYIEVTYWVYPPLLCNIWYLHSQVGIPKLHQSEYHS